ncbi:MAG TPA: NADH-quinone oxidoreductase subunit J [Humisphaera sp.]
MNLAALTTTDVLAAAPSATAEAVLFYLFATLTAASALAVVASRNIVRMSVALLFALTGVAGLFFLLQAEFLAAVQLVVYVGGTLILIVFGVMLTSKSPFSRFEPTKAEVAVAVALAAVLVATLVVARPAADAAGGPAKHAMDPNAAYPVGGLGAALLGDYLLPFELASVLLLAVMIGAAYLAKARKREEP